MKKLIYILVVALVFISCSVHKNYESQPVNTSKLLRPELNTDSLNRAVSLTWEDFYTDYRLQALIREGLENNSDYAIAKLNIDEAVATLGSAKGALFPSVSVGADGKLSSFDGSKTTKTFSFGPNVSWEIDIFGKLSNSKKMAAATVEERMAYAQAVRTRLIATIAQYYYTLEMLDAQMKVTQETVKSWQEYVATQQALFNVAQSNRSTISQAEAAMLCAQTTEVSLMRSINEIENALCSLIGSQTGTIQRGVFNDISLPEAFVSGIPVKMLVNRPDVRQAEAALKAAFYATNMAKSAFYPSLTLSGSAGWTNNGGSGITNPGALLLQAAGSLMQPIFNNGQNRANLEISKARQEEAKITFKQMVLDAGNEVNNALVNLQTSERLVQLGKQQIEKLEQTLSDTQSLMEYSSTNYLQVIVARQSLLSAQLNLLSDQYDKVNSYVDLFQALGGGME